ncbi:Ribosomal RNA large subunit methyltransferase L [Rhodobacteraceae bacterium THAF1]|uniref:THUMP domain-containing class I SAM-dependent RNA methyltransferase n=1 Tax=Palleronia sp. THAF1 TaxID=2587842 RepID=UPI000F3B2F65|nr:class I SAM-dependent RNA methyltransferase [Palleronia sp. THAF1]QFU07129.1 Ribosomal RNA large subunit methyltransferase L [Palleronia sp. THAF1]VDC16718.1 Ribosomal RNA large subunit methyltransferase L [Rhodobacteraceae bacterium THAF1]
MTTPLPIFLAVPPGLEPALADEVTQAGLGPALQVPGGVEIMGDWSTVARANRDLRGPTRVLVRIAEFRAFHLAQLDKRARKLDWSVLDAAVPVSVETVTRKSKIYHAGAATQRIEGALQAAGLTVSAEAPIALKVRIFDDLVQVSVDTSGEGLHKRGHKEWVGKAPLRETMAALLLRMAGYDGAMPVVDPMCGSGTFVLEAAEWAAGLAPGRSRDFAFRHLGVEVPEEDATAPQETKPMFHGYDRDAGAIRGAKANAERAGIDGIAQFTNQPLSELHAPDGPPGLLICNPPYGARIGNRKPLFALYSTLGEVARTRFSGWRIALVTSDGGLAKATGLKLTESAPIAHGGLRVKLYQAEV